MPEVSKHIKEHYNVVGIVPGPVIIPGFGTVDFTTVSKEVADRLFESGSKYLKKKRKQNSSSNKG